MGGTSNTPECIIMLYHQMTPFEYQEIENVSDGLSFDKQFTYYSTTEVETEYVVTGEFWLVNEYFLEYLDSEYKLDITDYGTGKVITVAEDL